MGFTTGLLGGATLTYSILCLTLFAHKANRNVQHTLLSQSHILLNSAVDPLPPSPEPPAYEVRKTSLTEELKDKWNGEIENAVRRLQNTDWDEVRQRWERRLGNVFQRAKESDAGREATAAADRLKDNVASAVDTTKDNIAASTERMKDNVTTAGNKMKDNVTAASDRLADKITAAGEGLTDKMNAVGDRTTEKLVGAADGAREATNAAKDSAVRKISGPRLLELK